MPTYVYKCRQCKCTSEVFQKITEASLTYCEECQTDTLQRVPSGGLFQLQGGGWYAAGYASTVASNPTSSSNSSSSCCPCGKNEKCS